MGAVAVAVPSAEVARLLAVKTAMAAEADGKRLRLDLIRDLKVAVQPAQGQVKAQLRSWPSSSSATVSPALGSYLAGQVTSQVRMTTRKAGVAIRIKKTPDLRNFRFASRMLNRASWRHPVFGRATWVTQTSANPGFFDTTLAAGKAEYRAAVLAAITAMEQRIAARVKTGAL